MGRKPGSDKGQSKDRKEEIINLADRLSGSAIAKRLELSRQYVAQVLAEAEGETEAMDAKNMVEQIITLTNLGVPELAAIIGAPRENVWRWQNGKAKASRIYARRLKLLLSALQRAGGVA